MLLIRQHLPKNSSPELSGIGPANLYCNIVFSLHILTKIRNGDNELCCFADYSSQGFDVFNLQKFKITYSCHVEIFLIPVDDRSLIED